jgi:hypothetical protein
MALYILGFNKFEISINCAAYFKSLSNMGAPSPFWLRRIATGSCSFQQQYLKMFYLKNN